MLRPLKQSTRTFIFTESPPLGLGGLQPKLVSDHGKSSNYKAVAAQKTILVGGWRALMAAAISGPGFTERASKRRWWVM